MIIELEDEKTWPDEILKLLENNIDVLETSQSSEVVLSRSSPTEKEGIRNQFKAECESIVDDINSKTAGCHIVGYHCTRLLDYEAEEIRRVGFSLPSKILLQNRLQKAREKGIISQDVLDAVITANAYHEMPARENHLYFVCGVSAMQDQYGIHKFFQCWGSEAVFNSHTISEHRKKLFNLGEPVIIRIKIVSEISLRIRLRYNDA